MKKSLRKITRRILLAVSPSYKALCQLKNEQQTLRLSNRKLHRKLDKLLKNQAAYPKIDSSVKTVQRSLSKLSTDLTDILILNKDKLHHDVVKRLDFEEFGPIDVAHSVFDTSYRDSNHFFNEALGTNSRDLAHPYNFRYIDFKEGDVVIDIGGNLGLTSICLARMYPFLTIHCFEPIEENFRYLLRNLEMNHITNVHAHQLAVTSDGRPMEFTFNETRSVRSGNVINAQMAASYHPKMVSAQSIAFDEIFRLHGISKCKLLKIDCEGSEYEILNQTAMLPAIEYICGETHGGKEETIALFQHLKRHIPKEKMAFTIVGSKKGNYCLGEIEEQEIFA